MLWCCLFIMGLDEWEAMPYQWYAPAHAKVSGLECPPSQVIAHQSGPIKPLHHLAAQNAFWSIDTTALLRLAEELGIASTMAPQSLT